LLDPDDQLLVDTNFDSAYESGVTEYTSSKIFFRFNPAAASGPLTFQFVSASNNGVVFVHETSNISDSSAFEGVFSVVNYRLDSDGDGQTDAYDSDSDNDGCSDVLEAGFTDTDGDDKVLTGPLTFDDGTVDDQGRVVGHDYTQLPDDNDANGVNDFQEFNSIVINTPPVDVSHCESDIALFQVKSDGTRFQWQILDASGVWANLSDGGNYSGTNTTQLQIDNLSMDLNTSEYRVAVFKIDLVCPEYSSPAKLEVTPLPPPPVLASSKYGFCEDTNPTIGDLITAIGANVLIYDAATAIIPLPSSTPLSSSVYHVSALDLLGCESAGRTEVEVVVEEILISQPNILSQECDETDGVRDLKVLTNLRVFEPFISSDFANQQFQYYFDAAHTDELSDPNNHINVDPSDGITPLARQTIYVKITSVFDADVLVVSQCVASSEIVLETSLAEIPVSVSNVYYACESTDPVEIDGKTSFDASIFNDLNASLLAIPEFAAQPNLKIRYYGSRDDARDKKSALSTSTDYINQYPSVSGINWSDEIWANITVENSGSFTCFGFAKVADLIIVRSPEFDLDSGAVFCINESTLLIESKSPLDAYDYSWSHVDPLGSPTSFSSTSSDITITAGGTYTLTATTQGAAACSMSKSIVVLESELAQLSQESLIITDLKPNNENTVSVDVSALGAGDYEYALDSGPFQDSPIFNNVRPGTHTLAANDKTGCGTAFIDLAIVGYNKYFSPNNDGINDYWKILGVDGTFFSNSKVFVFDRYGRLLSQLDNNSPGWDGTFKGSPMPADDYWFRVELDDGRAFDGHFSLMR
jgi:gliding motility-associated-like protein